MSNEEMVGELLESLDQQNYVDEQPEASIILAAGQAPGKRTSRSSEIGPGYVRRKSTTQGQRRNAFPSEMVPYHQYSSKLMRTDALV